MRWCVAVLVVASLIVVVTACGGATSGGAGDGFGSDGKVVTDFGAPQLYLRATSVAVQTDGKIVAGGGAGWLFALARYTRNGTLDPSFGTGGKVRTFVGRSFDFPWAVAIQDDGKIVAAGGIAPTRGGRKQVSDFALVRFLPDGRLDASFGMRGRVLTDFGSESQDIASAIAVQPDGKIVAAGSSLAGRNAPQLFALARYLPDGRPDASFGTGGKVTTDFDPESAFGGGVAALAIQGDGKMAVTGSELNGIALARYTPDGRRLDPSFGRGGKALTSSGFPGAIAIQADGMIVVAGFDRLNFALRRYLPMDISTQVSARMAR